MKHPLRSLARAAVALALLALLSAAHAATFTTLVEFNGSSAPKGANPFASLILASDGNFYGTTRAGGTGSGTIFKMTPSGTLTTLVEFADGSAPKGSQPRGFLVEGTDGNFYGTTVTGGANGFGTVFKMTPAGSLTTLVEFNNNTAPKGQYPYASLVQGSDGDFYGTTQLGGANGFGTVFKVTSSGTLTTLVEFNDNTAPKGKYAQGSLIQGTDGNYYGNTYAGGANNKGTIFKMTSAGVLTTLVEFNGASAPKGNEVYGRLTQGTDGDFYGMTAFGGAGNNGTIFKMTAAGSLTTLVEFGNTSDPKGGGPRGHLIQASDGNFYGLAGFGGTPGHGTLFKMTPAGTLTTLVEFNNASSPKGRAAPGSLVQGTDGVLYGMTEAGGTPDLGTIFKLDDGLPAPSLGEINLVGNSVSIADGDTTPSTADHTDFGSVVSGGGTLIRTFTVQNTGTGALTLNGTPIVQISGSGASHFSVIPQSSSSVGGLSITNPGFETPAQSTGGFTYTPTGTGIGWTFGANAGIARNGSPWYAAGAPAPGGVQGAFIQDDLAGSVISQAVNFPAAGSYVVSFSIIGRDGYGANDIDVRMDGSSIGSVPNGSQSTLSWSTFTFTYACPSAGSHTLSFVGTRSDVGDYSSVIDNVRVDYSSVSIAASGSATFQIQYKPDANGTHTATVTIASDDSDEGTYNFDITGTGAASAAQTYTAASGNGNGTSNGTGDNLRVRRNGANIQFSADGGTTWQLSTPYASTTSLTLTGSNDDDTFVVDFSGGNPIPSGGLTVAGGGQTSGDALQILNGTHTTITHNCVNANDGNVVSAGNGTITYTGLEPVLINVGTVADVVFNLPAGPTAATLGDDGGGSGNGLSLLSGATFEDTTFSNPTGSLTINRGNASDTLTINTTPDFTATLTVGSGGSPFAAVTVAGTVTLASGKNLSIDSSATVDFSTASSDVTLSGTGTATITTTRNINFASGSSLTTANGSLTLSANAAGTGSGDFRGIDMNAASISSTGANVTLTGRGGNTTGAQNSGLRMLNSSTITGGGVGTTLSITGTGGTSTGHNQYGVHVNNSTITTTGGNVSITGTAGTGGTENRGVTAENAGVISAGGAGTVVITGTGGAGDGLRNYGVAVQGANSKITSNGGNVSVTGTGGTATSGTAHGVRLDSSGEISAGSGFTVSIVGRAGASADSMGISIVTSATASTAGGAALSLIADKMAFDGTAVISAGAGNVNLRQANAADLAGEDDGDAINVGSAVDTTANTLELSDAELDRVTAGTVNIGNASSGAVTVSAAISHPNHLSISVASAITINQAVTMAVNKNLAFTTTSTASGITFGTANSDLSASGTGTITLTATRDIAMVGGSSVTTANGNLTLSANAAGTTGGNFDGIWCLGTLTTSGTGTISVTGRGGVAGGKGIHLIGSSVSSTGTGASAGNITMTGFGGGAASSDSGIVVNNSAVVTTVDGDISLTGTGGTGTTGDQVGVYVIDGSTVSSTGTGAGAGTITIDGTGGGSGAANLNHGVDIEFNNGTVTSVAGNIQITGTAGIGAGSFGFVLGDTTSSGTLSSTGAATITVIADTVSISTTDGTLNGGTSTVTLRQETNGQLIDVGGADSGTTLGLADGELDRVTAGTINIGDANSGNMTVSAAISLDDNVSLANAGTRSITFNNTFTLTGTTKSLSVDSGSGGITIATTAISTTGTQTYQDAVNLTAGPTITASTVTFNSTVDGGQALTVTGNAVFNNDVGLGTSLTSLSVSGSTTINVASAGNDVQTTGAQTYTGAVTLSAATAVASTGAGDITFASTISGGGNAITVNTSGITRFQDTVTAASVITDAGGTTRIETASISATAASGRLELNDAVIVAVDTTLTSNGTTGGTSQVRFFSTVNSDSGNTRNLTVTTTSANATIQFDGAVGAVDKLSVVTINNAGTYTTLAAADFSLDGAFSQAGAGAASLAGDITTTADNISFNSAVTLGGNTALSTGAGAGDITFSSTVNDDGAASNRTLTLTAGTGTVTCTGIVGGTQALQGFTIVSAASANLNQVRTANNGISVTATAITLNASLASDGDAALNAGTVSLAGSITLGAATVTIDTDHATLADGNINFGTLADNGNGAFRTLNLTAGGGTVTFTTSPGALNLEVDGTVAGTSHDRINVTGTINLNNTALTIPNSTIASSIGQTLTLIDNDGTGDAVVGTFNGQAQNSLVTINGSSFRISYTGGDGNDVTLTEATDIQVTLSGDDLTVADASNTADNLTIALNGANVRISDSSKILSAGPGTTQVNANTVDVPLASLSPAGTITLNGNGGNDTFTRNFTGGNIDVPITWNGGAQTVSDTLVVTGGGAFATVTHTFTSASDGSVAVTGNGLISYTGLEPVTDNLSATDRVFDFTGGAETITLSDNVAADGNMRIDSTLGELVDFANPTTSLTINAGTGDDQITVTSVDAGFTGALTINGDANTDNITITAIAPTISALTTTSETLAALPTLSIGAGGLSLTTSAGAITQAGATTLTVTGTATLAAGAANNITLANVGNNFSTVVITSGNDVSLRDAGAINLGNSTVSGSLTVNAAGLIDFTGAGVSTVGTTMGLTTTAGGITDSGGGTLAVTGTSTLAAGAANNITLDNNNNFTTVAVTSGNNVTLNDTVANLTLNASTVSGTLTVNVTTLNASLTVGGAVTYGGTVTFVADNMAINNNVTSGGTGTVNLRQNTAGTLINLGAADAAGTLGLTDAEIDRFIGAGTETINIGNTSSGAITISDTIVRATAANLVITTAANNDIAFSGATAALGANGGNATLTTSGTGAITSGALVGTELAGATVSLNAGSGGIGASGNPIRMNATTLNTLSANADQYLLEAAAVTMNTLDAGAGFDIHLTGGQFSVAAAGATVVTGDIFVDAGSLNQIASGRVVEGGPGGTLTIGATGTVVIHQTGATPYNTMFDGRAAPTLVSGSIINWQSTAATTVDLTTFENVNFNGAGPFALSGNTTVTTAGNTMTVSTGSRLNTGAFFVDGAGNFTLQSDGTLGIGSAAGITSAGATGSIRVTGTRSFNASGDYVYNGVALQVTGNGLPVTLTTPGSLTINNASNVELTQDTTTDLLVLTSGRFFTENGGGDRLLTTTAPISGGGAGSYVVGRLARSFIVGAQEHVFHVGDAANYAPFDVGFGAGSFTVTTGGTLTARVFPDYGGSTAALHPNLTAGGQPIAGLESTDTILRYWRLTPSGGLAGSYFPAATYANADIQGDETRYVLRRYNDDGLGTMWHLTPNNNRTPGINTVFVDPAGATPVTLFGDYTVGEQKISFYTLSHPNSVGEEINVNFGLTVTPRDYLGGAVLSGHESVTLTYNAYYANSATATANFTFNTSGSPYSGAGAFTTGSQTVTGQGTVRETLDIVVMDGSSRTGILEDLIIGNAPTAALAGTAVRMTGTGYGLTDNLGPEFTDESITVEMWFNVDATGTGGVLFDERGAANTLGYRASWIEAVGPVGGPYEIRLRVWNIPQAINGNNPRTTGLAIGTVTAGGWHHVTLRYDKALLRLDGFLDGVKSASFITGDRTTPFEVNASNPVVREGIFFGIGLADDQHLGNGLGFKGDLDELRIWDGARSDAQILDNWTKTVDPASAGLVAYYHFDDGSGTVAQDATSNGFDLAFASLTPPASYTPTWVSSTALSGVAALTYSVEVGETVVITLDGFDPEDTGTLTANVGAVTGSWGVNANLRQYDNTLINAGGVAVTDSARRVKVQGLAGGGPLTFQYTVNNGIANSPAITVTVNVVGATGAPTINASGTVAPASNEDTSPVTITRAQIAAALAAADPAPGPGATIAFRVRSLVNGKLQINGTNIVDNSTFITGTAPLNSVTWYPPANVSGIVDAFIVDAYDGSTPTDGQYSANTGIVRVNLTALNDAPITQVVTTALDFDGTDDYLFTPNLRSAFSNETVTLEVWFRPSTNATGQIVPGAIISERGQNSTNGWRNTTLELLPSGQVKARIWNITAINLGTVDTNNWNHAVVRYDKSTLKVSGFLNRVASSTLAGGVGNGDRKAPWEDGRFALHYDIGAPNDMNLGSGARFKGQVAEFRIWTIARTDAAILGSYLGADLTNERGLLAWYKLDEAVGPAGATTPDDSVNNHDATLFGTPQFVNVHPMIAVAGSYVIKLPAIDVEDQTMTWVVNTTAAQLNGGKLYHNLGGAVGAEIPTDAAIALFPVANGTVYYVPPSGGPADHEIYFYVADASGAVSTTASVKISVTAALRRAGDYAGGGAGDGAGLSYAGSSGSGMMGAGGSGASGGGSGGASGFSAASLVQFITPADGSGWVSSDTETVIVAVSPLLGQAAFVEVFADGESLGLAVPGEAGIWALSVNGVPAGTYQLRAVAVDSVGTAILSLPVTVTVSP